MRVLAGALAAAVLAVGAFAAPAVAADDRPPTLLGRAIRSATAAGSPVTGPTTELIIVRAPALH
jgi:hypothetical protein